ncbi:hypothetical protein [Vibrio owensii]|uniref:hypothetical protein n=1 Tax=Vibrio owensii TaxID=696485 RepID=UPI0018F23AA9|nr:hypothetical protein [Vibrio owensii]
MNKLASADEKVMTLEEFGGLSDRLESESAKSEITRTWLSRMTFGMISEGEAVRNIELELKDSNNSRDAIADDVFVFDMKVEDTYKIRVGLFFIPVRMEKGFSMSLSRLSDLVTAVFDGSAAEHLVPAISSRVWPVIIAEAALSDVEFWVHSTNAICTELNSEESDKDLSKWESDCPYGFIPFSVGVLTGNEDDDIDDFSLVDDVWEVTEAYVSGDAFKDGLVNGLSGAIQNGAISNPSRPTIAKSRLAMLEIETISEQDFDAHVSEAYGQETFAFDAFVASRVFNVEQSVELLKEALLSASGSKEVGFGGR